MHSSHSVDVNGAFSLYEGFRDRNLELFHKLAEKFIGENFHAALTNAH